MSPKRRDNVLSMAQWRDRDENKYGLFVDVFVVPVIVDESIRELFFRKPAGDFLRVRTANFFSRQIRHRTDHYRST